MMFVTMMVTVAVSAAFGLERSLDLDEIRSQGLEHVFDDVVGPNAKDLILNLSGQMPVSQMPGQTHELIGVSVPDLDNKLRSGLDLEPPSIFKLQAIAISHGDCVRKIEKDIFALIPSQANASAMARIKVEGERAGRLFRRPIPRRAMN